MSTALSLREFIIDRLTAAAADIFSVCEQTIVRYEQEIDRQRRLLEISLKPRITLTRIDTEQQNAAITGTDADSEPTVHEQEVVEPPQIKEEEEESNLQPLGENQECTQTEHVLVKTEEQRQNSVKREAELAPISESPRLLNHDSAKKKPQRRSPRIHANSPSAATATLTLANAKHSDSETMSSDTDDTSNNMSDSESENIADIDKNIWKISSKRLREKMDKSRKWLLCFRCEERKGLFNDHTYHKPVRERDQSRLKDRTHSHCDICGDCLILGKRCYT